jgi:hypothetical protein
MRLNRQGDVLFRAISELPAGKRAKRANATVAYGEVTGHAHAVMSPDTADVIEIDNNLFVHANERGISIEGDIARILPEVQRIVDDPSEQPLRRDSARCLLGTLSAAGAIILHGTQEERTVRPVPAAGEDRHLPTALAPGNHAVTIQREYSPGEIRNVID